MPEKKGAGITQLELLRFAAIVLFPYFTTSGSAEEDYTKTKLCRIRHATKEVTAEDMLQACLYCSDSMAVTIA